MLKTIRKLFYFLTYKERSRAKLIFIMILIMALLDMVGVASILPFMTILSDPSLVNTNHVLNKMYEYSSFFGVKNQKDFLFALGLLTFILLIISIIFKAITTYFQLKFIQMTEFNISKRLVENFLCQPYSWFLYHHSADLGKSVLSEVSLIIGNGIKPIMELFSKGMIVFALIFLLILTDPKIAFFVFFFLGCIYGLIYKFIRKYIRKIGRERLEANESRFKVTSEAFGASKEVKVYGLELSYVKKFSRAARIYALCQASLQAVSQIPRFLLEIIAFGGMLILVLYLLKQSGNFLAILPVISVYAFAGYRLMPAFQIIYTSITQIRFVGPALEKLYNDIKKLQKIKIKNEIHKDNIIKLKKEISLNDIIYNYPLSDRTALKKLSLRIPAKSTIGIVGPTGSGKTTTVDIILGLLEAQSGTLKIDDQIISHHNVRNWQSSIGYVPQNIYLADDTISTNIAFGVEPDEINFKAVERAAKIANIHNFVINELPQNYQTRVGERGVRLSGGQRQRIGIARAIYNNPSILIFDEATSALDNLTEKLVMEAIDTLSGNITIIMIAHRLSTVKKCDKIFILENGQLKNEGTFEELTKVNENFRINTTT